MPVAGTSAGGTLVTITGTGFFGATAVRFGNVSEPILSNSGTQITVDSPAASIGTVDVTIVTPGGSSALNAPADQFRFITPPTAGADSYAAPQGSPLVVAAPGVLGNDNDAQNYGLTASLVTNPAHGQLVLNSDGSFTYTPTPGYLGGDSFNYQASDGFATSATATVTINVGTATLVWNGTGLGNWTDPHWIGATLLTYPDGTANAIVNTPYVVQVTGPQTAYSLQVSDAGQVNVTSSGSLLVVTTTDVSSGEINIGAGGHFTTTASLEVDAGGSLVGGVVTAGQYQFTSGTASSNLTGTGGLTKDTAGTVVLSGADSYAGGTVVKQGTLIVTGAGALPDGNSLTIGASGTFLFDPSQTASNVSIAGVAASTAASESSTPIVAASTPANVAVAASATLATTVGNTVQQAAAVGTPSSTHFRPDAPATPAAKSSVASDAVFKSYRSPIGRTVAPADNAQSAPRGHGWRQSNVLGISRTKTRQPPRTSKPWTRSLPGSEFDGIEVTDDRESPDCRGRLSRAWLCRGSRFLLSSTDGSSRKTIHSSGLPHTSLSALLDLKSTAFSGHLNLGRCLAIRNGFFSPFACNSRPNEPPFLGCDDCWRLPARTRG